MSTSIRPVKNTVPVGKTPVPKYGSWDELREAMHRAAEAQRAEVERRRVETATAQRSSR